ncbi:MAG TPA: hypothetical protein VMT66_16440 [Steroidobacteraceae bacterium]|nr:hypothetical protein [Steroidobacteraceae bacterium]
MGLRAVGARWFELLTAREELPAVLRALAATGVVELESHADVSGEHVLPRLRAVLDEYRQLERRYASFWPPPDEARLREGQRNKAPEQLAEGALQHLRAWVSDAGPLVERLRQLAYESSELAPLEALLSQPLLPLPDLTQFSNCGPVLASRAYLLPERAAALAIPSGVLIDRAAGGGRAFLLALGAAPQIAALDDQLSAIKARRVALPRELPAARSAALGWVANRGEQLLEESRTLQGELQKLHHMHLISSVLGTIGFIEWVVRQVPELSVTENFAWVTGWTSDASGTRIESALQRAQLQYLLRFTAAPSGLSAPVVLRNPRWLQPFELFSRLLGVPAAGEADPSRVLAFFAPLLFGFMFGDVGQGAVLMLAGLALRRRYPAMSLLIPGGAAAVAFGFAFGSLFCREDVLRPLWLRPIDEPLVLLKTSLLLGVCVIVLGLALAALQYVWSAQARIWWMSQAGLACAYLGVIARALGRPSLWCVPAGLAWSWLGSAALAARGRRWQRLAEAVGESLEVLLQLIVNTISFVRVGAFALAHAGLAAAITGVVAGIGSRPLAVLVLALGNALVIAIEGLVVGIQTTRLVLFEFFIRFLKGAGRPFRPLPLPSTATRQL